MSNKFQVFFRIRGGMQWRLFGRADDLPRAIEMRDKWLPPFLEYRKLQADGVGIIDPDGRLVKEKE